MRILTKCFGYFDCKNISSSPQANNQLSTQIEELCNRFSLVELRKSTNNFNKRQKIGRGGYGEVYKGCICIQGVSRQIAVKRLASNSSHGYSEFLNEIQLLCQLRHPNLVPLLGFCNEKEEKILVYEYMPKGTLSDHLNVPDRFNNLEPLSWKKRLEICIGAARGLHYLHTGAKRSIFHRHVKPANIVLDKNWMPKLVDFGFSLVGSNSMSKPKTITVERVQGTDGFMAPEYCMSLMFTEKCDLYSFGIVLLIVLCGRDFDSIFWKINELDKLKLNNSMVNDSGDSLHSEGSSWKNLALEVIDFVQQGKGAEIIDPTLMGKIAPKCWKIFMDITQRCLLLDPTERPSIGEVEMELEHALALQQEADAINTRATGFGLISNKVAPHLENSI